METLEMEWLSAEANTGEGPSLGFIRAIADLLETDPDDLLAEMGYVPTAETELAALYA